MVQFFAGVIINRLWISNYFSDRAAEKAREELLESWNRPSQTTVPFSSPASTIAPGEIGPINAPTIQEAFALLYIPRIGNDVWATQSLRAYRANNSIQELATIRSRRFQEKKAIFLFGHRNSYGQPLINIQKLQVDDEVIVETKDFWFVYILKHDKIVRPSATWVTGVNRLPELGLATNEPFKVITLITCEPRHSTEKRWVWWGVLKAVYPHATPPPALVKPND